jgi:hypothetical protein
MLKTKESKTGKRVAAVGLKPAAPGEMLQVWLPIFLNIYFLVQQSRTFFVKKT